MYWGDVGVTPNYGRLRRDWMPNVRWMTLAHWNALWWLYCLSSNRDIDANKSQLGKHCLLSQQSVVIVVVVVFVARMVWKCLINIWLGCVCVLGYTTANTNQTTQTLWQRLKQQPVEKDTLERIRINHRRVQRQVEHSNVALIKSKLGSVNLVVREWVKANGSKIFVLH